MNCHAVRSILDLYAEERLSARWTRRVKAHLDRCPSCARTAAALRPAASSAAAPASLKDRLRRAAAGASNGSGPALPPLSARSTGPAALLALALAGLLLAVIHAATPSVGSHSPVTRPVTALWRLP